MTGIRDYYSALIIAHSSQNALLVLHKHQQLTRDWCLCILGVRVWENRLSGGGGIANYIKHAFNNCTQQPKCALLVLHKHQQLTRYEVHRLAVTLCMYKQARIS